MVSDLFRFMDLIMALPDDLAQELRQTIQHYQRRDTMPLLSQTFRLERRDGAVEEARESAIRLLDELFPEAPESIRDQIRAIRDLQRLRDLHLLVVRATSLSDIERQLL